MQYAKYINMQKQFSSVSETVQSSQNSSNSCTVQSLQYRFNTKLMSVRQMTSASLVTHAVGTRRAKSLMPTRHQRDPRVARCDQTHLAVVVFRLCMVYRPDCRSGCRCRPHQHDQHRRRRRPCSSTDESQSRHHMTVLQHEYTRS